MDPAARTPAAAPRPGLPGHGAVRFARYAYPPNALGYCGPSDPRGLLEQTAAGVVDPGLGEIARGFSGAWPYLTLIAGANRIADPLDPRVVEAYWIGNRLLDAIDVATFGTSLDERFRRMAGPGWRRLADTVPAGGLPHHSFHVLCVYPWLGLLRQGRGASHALMVLDRCRIRWGQVVRVDGGGATVRSRPLRWDGQRLSLGEAELEQATVAVDGLGLAGDLAAGDWVALHWDWVCERLDADRLQRLRRYTARTLALTDAQEVHSGPASVLG